MRKKKREKKKQEVVYIHVFTYVYTHMYCLQYMLLSFELNKFPYEIFFLRVLHYLEWCNFQQAKAEKQSNK